MNKFSAKEFLEFVLKLPKNKVPKIVCESEFCECDGFCIDAFVDTKSDEVFLNNEILNDSDVVLWRKIIGDSPFSSLKNINCIDFGYFNENKFRKKLALYENFSSDFDFVCAANFDGIHSNFSFLKRAYELANEDFNDFCKVRDRECEYEKFLDEINLVAVVDESALPEKLTGAKSFSQAMSFYVFNKNRLNQVDLNAKILRKMAAFRPKDNITLQSEIYQFALSKRLSKLAQKLYDKCGGKLRAKSFDEMREFNIKEIKISKKPQENDTAPYFVIR